MSHSHDNLSYLVQPGGTATGTFRVPGDKSISHRAIMFGAIAEGTTEVTGFLEGEDALSTMQAFRAMGVPIEGPTQGRVVIHGVGKHGLQAPTQPLDCGNAGTAMRLLAGLLAGQNLAVTLIGDASLSKRPMRRVTVPLGLMGAQIDTAEGDRPPLQIRPVPTLKGLHYTLPMASAQVKSALLLAGLYAEGETVVTEPAPTRDHTERMLRAFGYAVVEQQSAQGKQISVQGGGQLKATQIDVPADISSAAFFMVAAAIAPNASVLIQHVGINPTRTGVIDILQLMGADLTLENVREVGGEPVADIRVRSSVLRGITIPEHLVPLAIDEFPVLFVAAANAIGTTLLTGAAELRVKESDRIQVMADGLRALGVEAEPLPDGMRIVGLGQPNQPVGTAKYQGATIHAQGDHRIAMSFTVAALCAKTAMQIHDCQHVATSFPGFAQLAQQVGIHLQVSA
ncbi:3-phosphoshikimate 1-carboxyvinyltransferase [Parvibium lacunae]|uniref:3-phosphoshikimate 1-carboxyvinyltransferase n=1 Tax=Parvibium lacunae TaxID=1888893 RepID=A0A368L4K7_9BURK|nr:3-phosphoshikimate 1-carboxyvinyltransferase [Parvibium lacunae]RCS58509.1 3-phosphoshikimate 1-carboxyvinyltransferase [Parvibium lacunae]